MNKYHDALLSDEPSREEVFLALMHARYELCNAMNAKSFRDGGIIQDTLRAQMHCTSLKLAALIDTFMADTTE